MEEVVTEMERTFDFDIQKVKFPTDAKIKSSSDDDTDTSADSAGP